MKTTKKVVYFGIGIALYAVLGMSVNIPLIGHIQTDLGYIAYGVFLYLFGVPAFITGTIGCIIESMIVSGWFPTGWMIGQIVIGLICGFIYKKTNNKLFHVLATIIAVFIGVGLIKTVIECYLYTIPFPIKFVRNFIAFLSDVVPMIVGLFIGYGLKKRNIAN